MIKCTYRPFFKSAVNHNYRPLNAAPTNRAIAIHQAIENSDSMGLLAAHVKRSSEQLKAVESLISSALRPAVNAGPIDGDSWCLLVSSNAAAAKLRQLLPLMLSRLNTLGWTTKSIRLKILIEKSHRKN